MQCLRHRTGGLGYYQDRNPQPFEWTEPLGASRIEVVDDHVVARTSLDPVHRFYLVEATEQDLDGYQATPVRVEEGYPSHWRS